MNPIDSTQSIDPGPAVGSGENCSAASAAGFSTLTGAPAVDFLCGLNPPSFPRSPAQVRFTPKGDQLVVTVKGTTAIYVFELDNDGRASNTPTVTQSPGPAIPSFFGFNFDKKGDLLATELFGSASGVSFNTGALSSFKITNDGHLSPISSHVGDGGTAACWIALEPINGRFAYVANNLSDNISSYTVGNNGAVTLLKAIAAVAAS